MIIRITHHLFREASLRSGWAHRPQSLSPGAGSFGPHSLGHYGTQELYDQCETGLLTGSTSQGYFEGQMN